MPRRQFSFSILGLLGVITLALTSCGGGFSGGGSSVHFQDFKLFWSLAIADLNGDGRLDIAATYTFTTDNLNKSEGFVVVYIQNPARPGSFLAPLTYSVGETPVALAVGDLNGDGKPDLVVVNSQTGNPDSLADHVSVLLQDAANPGHFLSAANYPIAHLPTAVAIGDLDGDGKADLAVSDLTGVSLLLQNPSASGVFSPYTEITTSGFANSIAIADLNTDGKQDLVITDGTAVQVLLQTHTTPLAFAAPVKCSAGLTPVWVITGDLDSDRSVDLVVVNAGAMDGTGGSVSILLQNPAALGTFLLANTFPTGRSATFAATGD